MLLNFLHWLAEQEQLLRSRTGSLDTRMRGMIFPYNDHRLFDCYLGRSVGGHMLVHELLMDRSKLIQKYKSG